MAQHQNDGGPAFPAGFESENHFQEGMSLRDWFAGQALAGYIASFAGAQIDPVPDLCAAKAYAYADAILAERSKTEGRSR